MPLQDPTSIIVRGALQDVSIQYKNSMYVADSVFPLIDNVYAKTQVAKYVKGSWFRDEAEPRGPGAAAVVGDFNVTTQNLDPINYAYATTVTDEERQQANVPGNLPIQPDIDAQEFIADKLDMKREVRCAAVLHAAAWSGQSAGGVDAEGHWGDATAASDTFLADIVTARDTILAATGLLPNSLLLSWPAWSKLQMAPALLALMNPQSLSSDALVQPNTLAALIGIENLIIAASVKNTAQATQAGTEFTGVNIWGTSAAESKGIGFLYYRPTRPGLKQASAGYQYRVMNPLSGSGRLITQWREDARHSDMYDANEEVDISAVCLDAGFLFKDTATT
ncbi:MAG TPA: hypothetical protein VMX17_16045 [Candidatus Glassbacteria bacterium]|nr:hypothetical protein [Candidatus Glassbacteria bacterium]